MNNPQFFQVPNQFPQPQSNAGSVLKIIFTVLILVLWMISLGCEAYSDGTRVVTCFIFGWSLLSSNFLGFLAWFANIPFFVGYFMYAFSGKKTILIIAFVFACFAFLASLGAMSVSELKDELFSSKNEVTISYGALVWMGSLFLLVTGIIVKLIIPEPVKQKNFPAHQMQQFPPPMYPQFQQQGYYQNYPPQQNIPPQQNYAPPQNVPPQDYSPAQNFPPNNPQQEDYIDPYK